MPSLIGNKPNQVPSNGDLGTLAFQDSNAVNIVGGTAAIDNLTADSINLKVDSDLTNISPSLLLDFANTKALDPRITFTRASTATFYDGVTTAKAEENLFTQSESLSPWSAVATTKTDNIAAAPNGTTTASSFTETATSSAHYLTRTFSAVVGNSYGYSLFVKKGTGIDSRNFVQIGFTAAGFGANAYANFDLVNGTVTVTGAGLSSAAIKSLPNDWYRCELTDVATATGTGTVFVAGITTDTASFLESYLGSVDANVFLWGAQLEQRSAVSAYTPTTTAPITNYIPALRTAQAGQARFDHAPLTGESLGLLIEEQRTNMLLRSEEFDNASWAKSNATVTANTIPAPDGNLNADSFIESATNSTPQISQSVTLTTSSTYSFSCYAKSSNRGVQLNIAGVTLANFNLLTGIVNNVTPTNAFVSNITASITPVGNGWYRCSVTFTSVSIASSNARIHIAPATLSTTNPPLYTGDGYSGIFIWGAQLEAGAFATSYIPTVTSQVTRSPDAASMTGLNFSSWYRADEGTMFSSALVQTSPPTGASDVFTITDGTTSNRIRNVVGASTVRGQIIVSGSAVADMGINTTFPAIFQSALAYKVNDFAFTFNANTVQTDTLGAVPVVNQIGIGQQLGSYMNGTIKKLAYYPVRLPNAELQEMTS